MRARASSGRDPVKSYTWVVLGALSVLIAGAPISAAKASAAKAIVVDSEAALVYPLEDGRLVRKPIVTNNRKEFAWKDIGTFHISEKTADKRSNLYNTDGDPIRPGDKGAVMRYWMRLGWTALGFHQSGLFTPEGRRRRSNGCYRLSKSSAEWLFNWAPAGTPVHVVRRLKDSRFAGLAKQPTTVTAQQGKRAKAVARSPRKASPTTATSKPAPRAGSKPKVVIKPAPQPATGAARVTITRVADRNR